MCMINCSGGCPDCAPEEDRQFKTTTKQVRELIAMLQEFAKDYGEKADIYTRDGYGDASQTCSIQWTGSFFVLSGAGDAPTVGNSNKPVRITQGDS